jgi:hypothetical protein
MEASQVRLLVVVGLLVLVSVATVDRNAVRRANLESPDVPVSPALETASDASTEAVTTAEIARIREHLLRVERELLAADVSHLAAEQQANRMVQIRVLREYRERGVFPHNHVTRGRTPVFIDEHGTHCAVGYLIARSGRAELAGRIAATRNLARVESLVDIPGLVDWLDDTGLTLEEAAKIQPMYGLQPQERSETAYPEVTAIFAGIGGGLVAWNLLAEREGEQWWLPGAAGLGGALAGLGLAGIGSSSDDRFDDFGGTQIAINAGVGLLSGLLGVRTLALGRADRPPMGADDNAGSGQAGAAASLSPWWSPDGGAGASIALRF